ncbi:MAG: hypothetical protein AB8F95_21750 [Bacteroidia bacterium]
MKYFDIHCYTWVFFALALAYRVWETKRDLFKELFISANWVMFVMSMVAAVDFYEYAMGLLALPMTGGSMLSSLIPTLLLSLIIILMGFLFVFPLLRKNWIYALILAIALQTGWLYERFVIIITSIHRDFLSSSFSSPFNIDFAEVLLKLSIFTALVILVFFIRNRKQKL